jgi:hypothetical protein
MLSRLRHDTIYGRYYKDTSVHLSCTGDHILDIINMARTVNVGIMSFFSLVLHCCGVDGNSSLFFFRSPVNLAVFVVGSKFYRRALNYSYSFQIDTWLSPTSKLSCRDRYDRLSRRLYVSSLLKIYKSFSC